MDLEAKVIHRWPVMERARFAVGGKAICGVRGVEWHRTVGCVDADKLPAQTEGWQHSVLQPATPAKRVILLDSGRKFNLIDGNWGLGDSKKQSA